MTQKKRPCLTEKNQTSVLTIFFQIEKITDPRDVIFGPEKCSRIQGYDFFRIEIIHRLLGCYFPDRKKIQNPRMGFSHQKKILESRREVFAIEKKIIGLRGGIFLDKKIVRFQGCDFLYRKKSRTQIVFFFFFFSTKNSTNKR